MEFDIYKIQNFIEEVSDDCICEIENDYTKDELKKWDKVKTLEYFIEYLDFERTAWEKKYTLKKAQK